MKSKNISGCRTFRFSKSLREGKRVFFFLSTPNTRRGPRKRVLFLCFFFFSCMFFFSDAETWSYGHSVCLVRQCSSQPTELTAPLGRHFEWLWFQVEQPPKMDDACALSRVDSVTSVGVATPRGVANKRPRRFQQIRAAIASKWVPRPRARKPPAVAIRSTMIPAIASARSSR